MDEPIRRIVVLGGGTAGWMTASYLGRALGSTVDITVLTAPDVPTLGVGEATIPNLQTAFFEFLGISEDEWMRECNASYKVAIKFINWRTGGDGESRPRVDTHGVSDHFYHVFGLLPYSDRLPLSHHWVRRRHRAGDDEPFDYACYQEPPALDNLRSPRFMDGRRATSYAWHFDAHLVADFLRRVATQRFGVRHFEDRVDTVARRPDGGIQSVTGRSGATFEGDLFIDCSGFRGLLINQVMGEPFLDMRDQLLCDSAVATAVPHDDATLGVEPFTSAIAMPSGWTWKIPMLGRFGTGYVYSSRYASETEAVRDLCALWQLDPDSTSLNRIHFRVGRNRRAWVHNCVSIGTSSCFVEPLESTGIFFIYAALYQLVKHLPDAGFDPVLRDRFNWEIESMFDDTRDFIQAHYYFSPRIDTPFWKANKELSLSAGMQEKIASYRAGLPVNPPASDDARHYYGNFEEELRNFWNNSNYYCILAGLGVIPDRPLPRLDHVQGATERADERFEAVKHGQRELLETLPSCYEYLIRQYG
ncbi:tryptophan halogenase (plasmid) [Pseudonocardia sp. EC080610-09]|uniref:tryptophan halogenase family protein n=1 Tax=Pseudonocardia sp. EC080610-09 TaxID=1688404 RepID=UPI000706925C|nr:tryptophan halogenase family protein [Pseudonocardia sp. EC080610-09]ALL79935.1 tryptophan halogenase [Pseudonocardia sp. EC080610-09]